MIRLSILYNRINAELMPFCESISLVERLKGKASTLDVVLCDVDGRFSGPWSAVKGDALQLAFGDADPEAYAIDRVSVSASPKAVTWSCSCRPRTVTAPKNRGGGNAPPASGALVDKKLSWGTIRRSTLRDMASRVCRECGLSLVWTPSSNPDVENVARFNETGFNFLTRYARMFGFGVHADADRITITAPSSRAMASPPAAVTLAADSITRAQSASDMAPAQLVSRRFDARSASVVSYSAGGDDAGAPIDAGFDAEDAGALYSEAVRNKFYSQASIVPSDRILAGAVVLIDGGLYEVIEMSYIRTGDSEGQSIKTRPV